MYQDLLAGVNRRSGFGLEIFTQDDLYEIHYATLDVLQNVGVRVMSKNAREYFGSAGCLVNEATQMVRIPPNVVEDAIRSAPPSFLLAARNPQKDYYVHGRSVAYTNFGEGIQVTDPITRETRPTTKQSLKDATRMCDAMENITVYERAIGCDNVPPSVKSLHDAEASFSNTSKHCFMGAGNGYNLKKIIEICAEISGGRDKLRERPIYTPICCPNSPLSLNDDATDIIIEAAKAGIPMNVLSMAMSGATGPVTLAGTLVTHNAEVLSGLVLCQSVNRGNPFIYGSSTTMMDLRYTTAGVGAPELGMISAAVAKMAQFYLLPSFVAGG